MLISSHFELKLRQTQEDLTFVHEIREATLFKGYSDDRNYADDQNPNNHNFVFLKEEMSVGIVRLDFFNPEEAAIRLVAILPGYQGQKLGFHILQELKAYARKKGMIREKVHPVP